MPVHETTDKNSDGARIFSSTFNREYTLFETFTRNLVNGNANYGAKLADYVGTAMIDTGTALANTIIVILAGLGILTAYYSLGLGLCISLIGVGVGIGFNFYRNRQKAKKCIDAVHFIEEHEMGDKIHEIDSEVSLKFSDYLSHCSKHEVREFAKNVHKLMADAIMERKVKAPMDLVSPEYMLKYQKLIPAAKPVSTFSFINVFKRLKQSIVDIWRGRKSQESVHVSVANAGLFNQRSALNVVQEQKPECEAVPVLNAEVTEGESMRFRM